MDALQIVCYSMLQHAILYYNSRARSRIREDEAGRDDEVREPPLGPLYDNDNDDDDNSNNSCY